MEVHSLNNRDFGFKVNEISYENPYDYSVVHRHSYFEIFLFDTGVGGEQMIDFKKYEIKNKTLFIVVPGQVHRLIRKESESGLIIQFTQEFLNTQIETASIDALFALKTNPVSKLSNADYESLKKSFVHLLSLENSKEAYKAEKIKHYFAFTIFQILGRIVRTTTVTKKDSITMNFLFLAEKHFIKERTIRSYALQLNIAVSKLNYIIKKDLGKTPSEVIQELLSIEIQRLILLEQISHKEISFHLNFDSASSYNRFVKKHLGCNPTEVIKSLKTHNY
jgi:AraC family transcriptional regulator, transcriptional activator of pobA